MPRISSKRPRRGLISILSIVAVLSITSASRADQETVPDVFDKAAPQSVQDLKIIQDHVAQLVPRLKECTVNLQIGRSQGSGVVISADGLVLTAAHVSGPPGRRVTIIDSYGNRYRGETLGRNTAQDGSMVKILSDRMDWPHAKLSEKDPNPGDWCLVLGHPGGLVQDRGVVLRLGRIILRNDWLIQSDCELVGGDSGGPLFDMRGDVIGINTRIGAGTELNFHVPASTYRKDWDRLSAGEDFSRNSGAYLGISVEDTPERSGVKVTDVTPRSPAARGGLKPGDLIVRFDRRDVTTLESLRKILDEMPVAKEIKLQAQRGTETVELSVTLGMRFE